MNKDTDTSQKVMDRILSENRWALPVHKQENKISKRLQGFSTFFSIILLVGISVSFLFISPSLPKKSVPINNNHRIVTTIKTTDFAKTFSNLDFLIIREGTVSSIGEPHIYNDKDSTKSRTQILLMLSILGVSMITLFMSWLSTEDNK